MMVVLVIIHIIVCIALIMIVLLQSGKGAEMGAAFGGSSQTIFGGAGPAPFLSKITTIAAVVFMLTSLALAYLSAHPQSGSVMKDVPVASQPAAEATAPAPEGAQPAAPAPQPVPAPEAAPQGN
jgi:preprotein translocase subunit SecG